VSGQSCFTFGVAQLLDGLDIVVVAVGLFAEDHALYAAARLKNGGALGGHGRAAH
jgi:putative tricarboxylic transport membrane protein